MCRFCLKAFSTTCGCTVLRLSESMDTQGGFPSSSSPAQHLHAGHRFSQGFSRRSDPLVASATFPPSPETSLFLGIMFLRAKILAKTIPPVFFRLLCSLSDEVGEERNVLLKTGKKRRRSKQPLRESHDVSSVYLPISKRSSKSVSDNLK
jgi:hypothetical protein